MSELGAREHKEAAAVINGCLNPDKPRSFFLYAGAGSGKTRSLVEALEEFRNRYGERFRLRGQRVSVITYTNAACNEIKRRLNFDSIIRVSTIHSFVWDLIKGFNADIRECLAGILQSDIAELRQANAKGRANSKTTLNRQRECRWALETIPLVGASNDTI